MKHGDVATIRGVLRDVRRRWMWHTVLGAWTRATAGAAIALLPGWLVARAGILAPSDAAVAVGVAASLAGAIFLFALWPLHRRPADRQVARFIEERCPQLDERLTTAVESASVAVGVQAGLFSELLYRDTARRVAGLDLDRVIKRRAVARRFGIATVSTAALGAVLWLALPVAPRLLAAWRPARATAKVARPLPAPSAARAPRVTRIDVHYRFPDGLGLAPRTETDGGDVYAPAGTEVQLEIRTDRPAASGVLAVTGTAGQGGRVPVLLSRKDDHLAGGFTVREDGAYRVSLVGADGRQGAGDTQYFIRVVDDTPPDVRVLQPAGDRQVTMLEEVTVTAHAEDDRGVKAFDLVYSVGGGPETAVPFATSGSAHALDGRQTMYLEDLKVRPGDFLTYYARARGTSGAGPRGEARSDIFFLQVTPFDEEFVAAQSQAMSGGAGSEQTLDDLVKAQKSIVVATWKLDRRARMSHASLQDDVQTVAQAQGELRKRASAMAGAPVAARSNAGAGEAHESGADGGTPLANAVEAMGQAERSLQARSMSTALPHETRALSELMKAQAANRRWQVMRAAGAGAGAGDDDHATSQDLSSLFDRELQREQHTNYEMPRSSANQDRQQQDVLDRLRRLAERQDELSRRQRDLAGQRQQTSADDFARRLERLSREQSDLRQQAEELAQQMGREGGREGGRAGGRDAGAASRVREASDAMRQASSSLRGGDANAAGVQSGKAAERLRAAEQQGRGAAAAAGGQRAAGDQRADEAAMALEQMKASRDHLAGLERRLADLQRQSTDARGGRAAGGDRSGRAAAGTSGREGEDRAAALAQLREQYKQELQRAAEQLNAFGRGWGGVAPTPEGQQAIFSSPGFHQDFSKWEELARGVRQGLEHAERALTSATREGPRDRLQAPSSERVPEAYRRLVEQYYRSLAKKGPQ